MALPWIEFLESRNVKPDVEQILAGYVTLGELLLCIRLVFVQIQEL